MLKKSLQRILGILGYELRRKPSEQSRRNWPAWSSLALTFYEDDQWFHTRFDIAQTKTRMWSDDNALRRQRHYTLNHLLRNSLGHVMGDICEVGCWRGLSTRQIAQQVSDSGESRVVHVFDSFEGLSEYALVDVPGDRHININHTRQEFACSLEQVQENLADFDFIKYYLGWVPERFSEVADVSFSFVHVDVDLYQPTRDTFAFFYPRLAANGIMVFDDYGAIQFPGAKQAIDEMLDTLDAPFFVPLPSGQAFLIK